MDGHSNSQLLKDNSCTGNLGQGIFACKSYATANTVQFFSYSFLSLTISSPTATLWAK